TERRRSAQLELERQEREAVREAQGEGDVEGARGEDRQFAGRVEPRRQEVRLLVHTLVVLAGRDDGPEEGRRPQGRQSDRAQELGSREGRSSRAPLTPRGYAAIRVSWRRMYVPCAFAVM